jgi:hypothetical protein
MRNAVEADIENIRLGVAPEFNVMYLVGTDRMHRVMCENEWHLQGGQHLFSYSHRDVVAVVHKDNLAALPKKQGTPAKPKKPHIKGTKPVLGYQAHRVKPGVTVMRRDGSVFTVGGISYDKIKGGDKYWCCDLGTGVYCGSRNSEFDIVAILDDEYYAAKGKKQEDKEPLTFDTFWEEQRKKVGVYSIQTLCRDAFNAGKESK